VTVAALTDVEKALGRPLAADEIGRVVWWLNAAELQIGARLGDVSLLNEEAVRYVEAEAAVARLSNPEGVASETIDDYTYRLPTESRRVTILDEWWAMLSPAADGFSTRPGFESDGRAWSPWS
jgi:hypothetical protein